MIAIIEAYKAGLLKLSNFPRNLVAGCVSCVIALPFAIGFSIAAGMRPEQGLYTAIISSITVALFGGTRVQIAGPTGSFVIILLSVISQYGFDGLQIASVLAGMMLVFMGLARLGSIIKFIPEQVIVGLTSGFGVGIFIGQLYDFLGFTCGKPVGFLHQKIIYLCGNLSSVNFVTIGLGVAALTVMRLTEKFAKKIPATLVGLFFCGILQFIFKFDSVATIGSAYGGIPQSFPHFGLPHVTFTRILELLSPAFAIAMLCSIEALLSGVTTDSLIGTKHSSNQELIGEGISNILCPFFMGFPATGAMARTTASVQSGANSPIAAVFSGILLIIFICFLAPVAYYIPLTSLSAILILVAIRLMNFKRVWFLVLHAPRTDACALLVTLIFTIFGDIISAVNFGVILSTFVFMQKMSVAAKIQKHDKHTLSHSRVEEMQAIDSLPDDVLLYNITGPLFFGMIDKFESAIDVIHSDVKVVILCMHDVPFIDSTGMKVLRAKINILEKRGIKVIFCDANSFVLDKLHRVGLSDSLHGNFAGRSLIKAIEEAKKLSL